MALEYIFRIMILLVAVAVIIGLILTFVRDARQAVLDFIKGFWNRDSNGTGPSSIEQESFNSGEVVTYIESCYATHSVLDETEQKDVVCYTLLASKSINANKQEVLINLDPDLKNRVDIDTDFSKQYVVIEFSEVGNRVVVR